MIRLLPFYFIYMALTVIIPAVSYAQGSGVDLHHVRSAHLAQPKTVDFRLHTTYLGFSQRVSTVLSTGDTVRLGGKGNIIDIPWRLAYGISPHLEFSVSGVTMIDKFAGGTRYGAGDTKAAFRFGTAKELSPINLSGEFYYLFPVGFDEGTRLIRRFSTGHGSPGFNFFSTFRMTRLDAHINIGYNHNGGRINRLPAQGSAFYYPVLDGTVGIGTDTRVHTSSQVNMGFGGDIRLFGKFFLFGEYAGRRVMANMGDDQTIGATTFGLAFINAESWQFKAGYVRPTGSLQSDGGFIFELRLNDVFGRKRAWRPKPQPKTELIPALTPGQKPFLRRETTLFAGAKEPVHDTVFLIDLSPSMMGRGLRTEKGENILSDLPNFLGGILEGIAPGSNVALVAFSNTVTSLTWSQISNEKKTDIQRSINDVPDEAGTLVRRMDENRGRYQTVEDILAGVNQSYLELENFKRGDYNRIHLQRIILVTDDIQDDSLAAEDNVLGFEQIRRRFGINNRDFRLFYYLLANRVSGKTVPQHIINFVEKEDGAILREVDVNRREEIVPRLNYNEKETLPAFKYLSQLTRIAIIPFKTQGKAVIGEELTKSFKSIFENNPYFMLSEQTKVDRLVQLSGLDQKERIGVEEAQQLGMQLGVDYIVTGEVRDFQVRRDKGLLIPYVAGLPTTQIDMSVAVEIIDVANGALAYSEVINADKDARRGLNAFAANRIDRNSHLSSLDLDRLRQELFNSWRKNAIAQLFQDITTLPQQ